MPGSWDIKRERENSLLVAIAAPVGGRVDFDYMRSFRQLQLPPGSDVLPVKGLPFGPSRNHAAKAALDMGRHLAVLDSDVQVEPDAFMKLLATGLEFVGGLYFQKFPPYSPVMFNAAKNQAGEFVMVSVQGWQPGQIVPAVFVPTGLTLYRHSLLQKMFARYPSPFTWGVDICPVLEPDGTPAPNMSEDFSFSFKATQIGVQPYVNTGIVGLHRVEAVVGPRWAIPMPSPDPLNGVCGVV